MVESWYNKNVIFLRYSFFMWFRCSALTPPSVVNNDALPNSIAYSCGYPTQEDDRLCLGKKQKGTLHNFQSQQPRKLLYYEMMMMIMMMIRYYYYYIFKSLFLLFSFCIPSSVLCLLKKIFSILVGWNPSLRFVTVWIASIRKWALLFCDQWYYLSSSLLLFWVSFAVFFLFLVTS